MSRKMEQHAAAVQPKGSFFAQPAVGSVLTVLGGVAFLFLCEILPLVGPAAAGGSGSPGATRAAHYTMNYIAFLSALLVTMGLSVAAIFSKLERRKIDNSPLPFFSMLLTALCVLLLVALFTGLMTI